MVVPPGPSCAVAEPSTLTALAARSRVTIAASPGPTTVGVTDTIFGVVAVAKLTVTVCSLSPEEEGDEEPDEEEPGGRDAVAVTVYRASGWRDPAARKPSAVSEPAIASPPSRVSVTRVRWASENFVATITGSFGLTSVAS